MAEVDEHDTANGVENGAEESDEVAKSNGHEINDADEENNEDGVDTVNLESEVSEIVNEDDEDTTLSKTDIITVDDKGDDAPSKTITDAVFFANISEEEKEYYENKAPSQASLETMTIQCTACWKQVNHHVMNSIMRHPVLGVSICRSCRYFYDGDGTDEAWEKDEDGVDMYCRWCGQGGEVLGCDDCKYVFCKKCITRNLGRGKFAEINDSDKWSCFSCDPSQVYKERALMFAMTQWMAELKIKKKMKDKLKTEKKKTEGMKKKVEAKRKIQEAAYEKEASKVDNFVDEAFHEAFETLNIYQKCLQDEQKKWIKQRKNMNPNNTATIVKSLRKIFSITKQNMALLDTTLVQGYSMIYPEEGDKKIRVQGSGLVDLDDDGPGSNSSTPVKTPRKRKRKIKPMPAATEMNGNGEDIQVEEIVVNGESVLENMENDDEAFDPSLLCSVEITAVNDRESSSSPELKRPRPIPQQRGPMKLSNSMFKKKQRRSPLKVKKRPKPKKVNTSDIEEITLTDDDEEDNNTSYVTQAELSSSPAVKKNLTRNNDEDESDAVDSDVSLE